MDQINHIIDLTALHKNGAKIPIELTLKLLTHRGKTYFFAFIRECSKKKTLASQFHTLNKQNKLLKKLLNTVSQTPGANEVIEFFLDELAQFKQCELAFVCKKDFGQLNRTNILCNKTQLNFKDFSHQVDEELKKLAKINFPSPCIEKKTEWIENIQMDWDSPFFIFGRNFGFHGCLLLPIKRPDGEWLYLFFLSTQFIELSESEMEFLNESRKNLENMLKLIKK